MTDKKTLNTTTKSACCIVIPDEFADAIQELRITYDKSARRWPPHINIVWPFIPNGYFYDAIKQIESNKSFQSIKPFEIKLERFSFTPGFFHFTKKNYPNF